MMEKYITLKKNAFNHLKKKMKGNGLISVSDISEIKSLIKPHDASEMTANTISQAANSAREQTVMFRRL